MVRRWVTQLLRPRTAEPKVLLIFGCQRSGTTLLSRIFEGDPLVCSYAEHSKLLSRPDHMLRTRSLEELERVFSGCRGHLIVAKPLVESQRATRFLEYFPGSKVVWSFRHHREVVRSFVKLFDRAGINIMKKIIDGTDNWAAESVSDTTRDLATRYYHPDMSPHDGAALFWLIRNALYFEQALDQHPRVMTCKYDDLVSEADQTMRRIYSFVDLPYPGSHLVGGIHEESRGLGKSLAINPEIESLCEAMWVRLVEASAAERGTPLLSGAL